MIRGLKEGSKVNRWYYWYFS